MNAFILIFFMFMPTASIAQQSGDLGIFDATADWGLEPHFPPKRGDFKVPGWVDVSNVDGNYVYDMYGNGDRIYEISDEGFYLYKTLPGSWSLSGKIKLIENDGGEWGGSAIHIRENGTSTNSKCFNLVIRFGEEERPGDRVNTGYRTQTGGRVEGPSFVVDKEGKFVSNQGDGVYFRISRISALDMFIAERSYDGIHWNFAYKKHIPMKESVAYGIWVNNFADNEGYCHAQISNVKLEPCPLIICTRQLEYKTYQPGWTIKVKLSVFNPQDKNKKIDITENIPHGCTVSVISPNGIYQSNAIHWNIEVPPGESNLTYTLHVPDDYNEVAHLHGLSGHLPIFGDQFIERERIILTNQKTGVWRYWSSEDGMTEPFTSGVYSTSDGKVLVRHKISYDILDGYTVLPMVKPMEDRMVRDSPDGQLWSTHTNGFQRFINGEWILERIDNFNLIQSIYHYFPKFIPLNRNNILYVYPDRNMQFNASTKSNSEVKYATDTKIGQFKYFSPSNDGDIWVTAYNGLGKLSSQFKNDNYEFAWIEYPIPSDAPYQDIVSIKEFENGDLFVTAKPSFGQFLTKIHFDLKNWRLLYSEIDRHVWGWNGIDDSFWIERYNDIGLQLVRVLPDRELVLEQNRFISGIFNFGSVEDDGVFWCGTEGGLARHSPGTWRTPTSLIGINEKVQAITEDVNGGMWFATNKKVHRYHNNSVLSSAKSINIFLDHTPYLFPKPDGNIFLNERERWFTVYDENVKAVRQITNLSQSIGGVLQYIFPLPNNQYLVSFANNKQVLIYKFNSKQLHLINTIDHPRESTNEHFIMFQTEDEKIWFGRSNGLWVLNHTNDKTLTKVDSYPGESVNSYLILENGNIWLGGLDKIYNFDGTTWTEVVSDRFGNINSMIQIHDSSILVGASNGVHRYHQGSWNVYDSNDGLLNAEVNTLFQDSQNRIWAGTMVGISLYHSEDDQDPPDTKISEDQNPKFVSQGIVNIVYSGMDKWKYTQQEHLLYSYRIDDGDWSPYSSERVTSIPNLTVGNHQFQVRSIDRNWNVDPTPAKWDFVVLRHWYQEPVFLFILAIGSIIILLSGGFHFYHHLNLAQLVLNRTKDLQNAYNQLRSLATKLSMTEDRERHQIASDLHVRIGHSLALCRMNIETLQESYQDENTSKVLEPTINLLRQTIQDTRNLTFEIIPPILYQMGFEKTLEWYIEKIQSQHEIEIRLLDDIQEKPLSSDSRAFLYRAVRELLFNVVKHAKAKQVIVSLSRMANSIVIDIKDDGVGFDVEQLEPGMKTEGYGLYSIQEFAKHMGGSLNIESTPNYGTHIRITIPLNDSGEDS